MCGIVGFNWQDEKLAKISADLLNHRGPDQSGVYTDALVSLSHRRLSIIDLSVKGNQPMSNEDQNIYLVFNGEIFNHKSLRRELQDKGHTFSSRSDSEVLVHLYEEYRTSML
ncbi:MAG: asparagine synthetase B, partial [Candidatus Omnitrophica bacterium]|nr:asparagine synthetase B [Candidatus Omnitrophota bacterium]